MDPITDILTHLDFQGMLYFSTEFSGDWGVRVPDHGNVIRFHLVLRGRCMVRMPETGATAELEPGDFLMIPHGRAHDLLHGAGARTPPLERLLEEAGYDGRGPLVYRLQDGGAETRLLCGHFTYEAPRGQQTFMDALPDHMVARGLPDHATGWFEATLALLSAEAESRPPGHDAILRRMTEVIFIQALRLWSADTALPAGILRAMADRNVARALAALHAEPQDAWTVEKMARAAGLSRSVFAERFHELSGTTPLRYLTEWRLTRARRMLLTGHHPVEKIAEQVGYRSVAAFSRVYARHFGEGPGRTRKLGTAA